MGHTHTPFTHPKRGDGGDPTPIPSGGQRRARTHTCERRHTHAIAQRREPERGGRGMRAARRDGRVAQLRHCDVSSPTSVGTVPLKELTWRYLRDREEREGEPSDTHTHHSHTPKTRRRRTSIPRSPRGGDTDCAHTHSRDATRTPSRRDVSRKGGRGMRAARRYGGGAQSIH